jgi:diacylglycerol kinase (ATP)
MPSKLLIWNGKAGKAQLIDQLRMKFDTATTRFVEMTRGLDLVAVIRESACEVVVAAGGDGTVNAVVNALMRIETSERPRLAVLPIGTANDFASTLALPDDIAECVDLLTTSQHLPVDVVRIEADGFERYYANIAAGGNSVRVAEEMTDELKSAWGAFCYLRGGLEVLSDLKSFRITADCGGELLHDLDTWAVLVANGRTSAGRIAVAPEASPIDGLLDVIIIRDGTALDIVEIVSNALLGSYLECEQVLFRQVPYLTLHSVPGMRFTLDGEVVDQEPVRFEIEAGAIEMYFGSEFLLAHSQHLREPYAERLDIKHQA